MPGPVNQVHKPKPLGEVLLLNSSQLRVGFFFRFPPRLIVNWGVLSFFPGSLFAREKGGKKQREQKIIAQEESVVKECFVTCAADPPPPPLCSQSRCSPAKTLFLCH